MNKCSSFDKRSPSCQGFTACETCSNHKRDIDNTVNISANPFAAVEKTIVTDRHPDVTAVHTAATSANTDATDTYTAVTAVHTSVTSVQPAVTSGCPSVESRCSTVTPRDLDVTPRDLDATDRYSSVTSRYLSVTVVFPLKIAAILLELLRKKDVFKSYTFLHYAIANKNFSCNNNTKALHALPLYQKLES